MKKHLICISFVCCFVFLLFPSLPLYATENYSVAINYGRVIDPETKLDAIRHIGLVDGRIMEVSTSPLSGANVIDASGLVVAPGFIDLHSHSPTPLGQYYQLFDGVTTALELEAGAHPVLDYGAKISDQPLTNYGASAGYLALRLLERDGIVLSDFTAMPYPANFKGLVSGVKFLFMDLQEVFKRTFSETADEQALKSIREHLLDDLENGSLGIGLALDYISEAVDERELTQIFEVASEKGAPIFVHVRRGINGDPSGLREVIELARTTGASVHVCHITHNAMRNTDLFLTEIKRAQQEGVDITTEMFPYNAGSAGISSAVFNRDWQTIFDISYQDVEWAASGERLSKESWEHYRKEEPQGTVIHHYLKEEWTRRAIEEPDVMIVSDILPMKSKDESVAPHNGSFTKILSKYVRDEQLISLPQAIEKMTLLPAKRLENYAPAFKKKGRIQVGADADITIFNPDAIESNASYRDPYQEASGLEHIFVNGVHLVDQGKLVEDTYPGKRLTAH